MWTSNIICFKNQTGLPFSSVLFVPVLCCDFSSIVLYVPVVCYVFQKTQSCRRSDQSCLGGAVWGPPQPHWPVLGATMRGARLGARGAIRGARLGRTPTTSWPGTRQSWPGGRAAPGAPWPGGSQARSWSLQCPARYGRSQSYGLAVREGNGQVGGREGATGAMQTPARGQAGLEAGLPGGRECQVSQVWLHKGSSPSQVEGSQALGARRKRGLCSTQPLVLLLLSLLYSCVGNIPQYCLAGHLRPCIV